MIRKHPVLFVIGLTALGWLSFDFGRALGMAFG